MLFLFPCFHLTCKIPYTTRQPMIPEIHQAKCNLSFALRWAKKRSKTIVVGGINRAGEVCCCTKRSKLLDLRSKRKHRQLRKKDPVFSLCFSAPDAKIILDLYKVSTRTLVVDACNRQTSVSFDPTRRIEEKANAGHSARRSVT